MTDQVPSKELAKRLRALDFGCRMPPSVIEEAADFLDGLASEPGADRQCDCIPLAQRSWKYCQDCGGRIAQPPGAGDANNG